MYLENNICGTFEILEAARAFPPDHMLLASTSSVYGANEHMPYQENQKADFQMSFYAATKKSIESMAHSYSHLFSLPTTICRFFTVYGPWGRPDMALYDFTNNIVDGNEIELFNYGNMIRDWTYVEDIVQGIGIVINKYLNEDASKEIYNIGRGEKVELMDFVDHIENNLDRKAKRKLVEEKPGEAKITWSDCTKLKNLGYKPETSIKNCRFFNSFC